MFPVIEIKDVAVKFLRMVVSGRIDEAFDECVADHFKHHNIYAKGDRESLRRAMKENHERFPHKSLEVIHAMEQHHLAAVHSLMRPQPGDLGVLVVHIMRFEHDQIVEMWDVGQPLPEKIINENGAI